MAVAESPLMVKILPRVMPIRTVLKVVMEPVEVVMQGILRVLLMPSTAAEAVKA